MRKLVLKHVLKCYLHFWHITHMANIYYYVVDLIRRISGILVEFLLNMNTILREFYSMHKVIYCIFISYIPIYT